MQPCFGIRAEATPKISFLIDLIITEEKEEQDQEISDLTRHVFESNSDCAQLNDEVLNLQNKLQSSEKSGVLLQVRFLTKLLIDTKIILFYVIEFYYGVLILIVQP